MPDDNVWLAQCWADRDALTRLLETIRKPGRAIQGADCGAAPGLAHPRHLDLDLTEGCGHDRRRSRQTHRHPQPPDELTRHGWTGPLSSARTATHRACT